MTELDRQLRMIATSYLDRPEDEGELRIALARVLAAGADQRTAVAGVTRPERRRWRPELRGALVAASVIALVASAAALVVWRLGGEGEPQLTEATLPPTVPAPTPVPVSAASSTIAAAVTTPVAPAPVTAPVTSLAPAAADATAAPAVVVAGGLVEIAPDGTVTRACADITTVYAATDESSIPVGQIHADGTWDANLDGGPVTVPACLGEVSHLPLTVAVPALDLGQYRFCIADDPAGCAIVTVVPPPAPTLVPVPYLKRIWDVDPSTEQPVEAVHEIAPDGTDLGPSDRLPLRFRMRYSVEIGDDPPAYLGLTTEGATRLEDGRCGNGRVSAEVEPLVGLASQLGFGRSIIGNQQAILWTRDMCPEGTRWGDPGTYFEIVRYDIDEPSPLQPTQLIRIDPDPSRVLYQSGSLVYATDELMLRSLSPDARFMGVLEPLNTEDWRYHVYSAETPGAPLAVSSRCRSVGDIVATPRFVSDSVVALGRECGATGGEMGQLWIDVVDLDRDEVLWSRAVTGVEINSYTSALDLISARLIDGDVWVLVSSSAGVESPTRAAVVSADGEAALPGGSYAFDVIDFVGPNDWQNV